MLYNDLLTTEVAVHKKKDQLFFLSVNESGTAIWVEHSKPVVCCYLPVAAGECGVARIVGTESDYPSFRVKSPNGVAAYRSSGLSESIPSFHTTERHRGLVGVF